MMQQTRPPQPATRSVLRLIERFIVPAGLILTWFVLTQKTSNPSIPTPVGVANWLWEMLVGGDLPKAIAVSTKRILTGFGIALITGCSLGLLMGSSRRADTWLAPIMNTFRPIAPYAWIPMAILWFGTGDAAAVFLVAYAAFFPILTNAYEAVRQLPQPLLRAARTLGAPRSMIFWEVLVPGVLPLTVYGLRLGLGTGWAAIVAAELTGGAKEGSGASGGLGQMLYVVFQFSLSLNGIVAMMVVIGVLAYAFDASVALAGKRLIPWRSEKGGTL